MQKGIIFLGFLTVLLLPSVLLALEPTPRITDREIIERLTKLEEGQRRIEESLRAEIRANAEAIRQLREDMKQLRVDMNAQFDRIVRMMLGILAAFAALVATTIGFAVWDRRTMIRPFESKVRVIEEELAHNRQRLHALLEALRALSQTDERVAEVLQKFHLL